MTTHQEILELLPWFVNGTLNEHEQSIVNDHLKGCLECNHEVEVLMATSQVFHTTSESWADSIDQARSDFLQQLDADNEERSYRSPWIIPTSLAACLLIAALFFGPMSQLEDSFETLGNNVSSERPVIQLVFHPDTTEMSIRGLILGDQGHIISGPSAQGVYRLELSEDGDPQQVLKRLKDHPDVVFAALETNP
jgi:hypothetical protein